MLIPATQLRVGMLINYQNDLYRIMAVTHVTPGNWRGMVQTKMRAVRSGISTQRLSRSRTRACRSFSPAEASTSRDAPVGSGASSAASSSFAVVTRITSPAGGGSGGAFGNHAGSSARASPALKRMRQKDGANICLELG